MIRRIHLGELIAATLLPTLVGCHCCRHATPTVASASPCPTCAPGAPQSAMVAGDPLPPLHNPVPPPAGVVAPPGAVVTPPASAGYPPQDFGGFVPPPYARRRPQGCPPPAAAIERQQGFFLPAPPVQPGAGKPYPPSVTLAPPEPTPPSAANRLPPSVAAPWPGGPASPAAPAVPPNAARLGPPAVIDYPGPPSGAQDPSANPPRVSSSPEPPRVQDQPGTRMPTGPSAPEPPARPGDSVPQMPVDIPHFAQARPNVFSGQQPYPDGVGWLKNRGYRTVLHIRPPSTDDSAARRLFENAGLKYLSFEVSPQTLSRDLVDRFNKLVTDPAQQPLFVYDRDGALAGALWYLHYRLIEKMPPDEARKAAAQLGFNDTDPEHKTMWVAVQTFLQANP